MEVQKTPRKVKPALKFFQRKEFLYGVAAVVALIVAGVLINLLWHTVHKTPSQKLVSTVSTYEDGHHGCSEGLKQVGAMVKASPTQYTNDVKEKALDYLMTCNFTSGNFKQALAYGSQLSLMYSKDGSKSAEKLKALAQFMNYIQQTQKIYAPSS